MGRQQVQKDTSVKVADTASRLLLESPEKMEARRIREANKLRHGLPLTLPVATLHQRGPAAR